MIPLPRGSEEQCCWGLQTEIHDVVAHEERGVGGVVVGLFKGVETFSVSLCTLNPYIRYIYGIMASIFLIDQNYGAEFWGDAPRGREFRQKGV